MLSIVFFVFYVFSIVFFVFSVFSLVFFLFCVFSPVFFVFLCAHPFDCFLCVRNEAKLEDGRNAGRPEMSLSTLL